ncbi:MAG: DUF2155 domain-containing protein [Rickettsiales bacterium]|jgi:hypothetical protein|nr:DUF2155 domain-containing protein [Rickettsiales bacterium]
MKKLLALLFIFAALPVFAEDADEMVKKDFAIVQVLDKTSGKTKQLKIPAGKESTFEKLAIDVKSCLAASEFQPEDYFAFFEVYKTAADRALPRIFSGWMMASSPGANPLEDENYDLWLVKCI